MFGIWVLTLLLVVVAFIVTIIKHAMTFAEAQDSLEAVAALIVPQLTIMLAFFFGASESRQRAMLDSDRSIAILAVIISFLYHLTFWMLLFVAVVFGKLAPSIDGNAGALVKIMSLLAALGISPVAFLFARAHGSETASSNPPTGRPIVE